jgi:hypothetical protein
MSGFGFRAVRLKPGHTPATAASSGLRYELSSAEATVLP